MPHADTRWSRGERVGCGCFLIAIGSVVAFFGLIWASMDGFYGESGIWAEAILFAGLAAGALGLVLVYWARKMAGTDAAVHHPFTHATSLPVL